MSLEDPSCLASILDADVPDNDVVSCLMNKILNLRGELVTLQKKFGGVQPEVRCGQLEEGSC